MAPLAGDVVLIVTGGKELAGQQTGPSPAPRPDRQNPSAIEAARLKPLMHPVYPRMHWYAVHHHDALHTLL